MKKFLCDFCGKETEQLYEISERFAQFLPSKFRQMCDRCHNKIDDFWRHRQEEALEKSWEETARFAKSIKK